MAVPRPIYTADNTPWNNYDLDPMQRMIARRQERARQTRAAEQYTAGQNADRDAALRTARTESQERIEANRRALQEQFEQQARDTTAQARATMSANPVESVAVYNPASLSALEGISGVSLDNSLAGTNTATSKFFIPGESTQGMYDIVPAQASGALGQRHDVSSKKITGETDSFGNTVRSKF